MEKEVAYQLALQWDVATWARALVYWEAVLLSGRNLVKGLELGARDGGLSYYFAKYCDCQMYCTDYEGPTDFAREWHRREGISERIHYAAVDAKDIPYEDNSFDFVVFKSVLGVVGAQNRYDLQERAIQEMHRIIRPGGVLFFAENAKASWLHQLARKYFVSWGRSWRYVSYDEMQQLLSPFSGYEMRSTGFLSAFAPDFRGIKKLAACLDQQLTFLPSSQRYVLYGHAVK